MANEAQAVTVQLQAAFRARGHAHSVCGQGYGAPDLSTSLVPSRGKFPPYHCTQPSAPATTGQPQLVFSMLAFPHRAPLSWNDIYLFTLRLIGTDMSRFILV